MLVVRSCQSDQKNKSVEGEIAVGFLFFLLVQRLFAFFIFIFYVYYATECLFSGQLLSAVLTYYQAQTQKYNY